MSAKIGKSETAHGHPQPVVLSTKVADYFTASPRALTPKVAAPRSDELLSNAMKTLRHFLALLTAFTLPASAAKVVTIGDSLTAEYDVIPDIPGFDSLPTDYAKVTVTGWEALSWVEVAAKLRGTFFDFGKWKDLSDPWLIPRLSGYEYNWAVPGVDAGQYENFVTSRNFENPFYFAARQPLEDQLSDTAQRVVIWLGGNDFRGNYGSLYDGQDSSSFAAGLLDDLGKIIDFVKSQNSHAQIVIVNEPDLGATPTKKAAHPDPAKRARVTAVTEVVNAGIVKLAALKGVVVADAYASTAALVRGEPLYFGGVRIVDDKEADNNPRYAFARDGLHPNTALQILNARVIIRAFNKGYAAGIPKITDTEALTLLGIDRDQPFFDWLARRGIDDKSFEADSDGDGLAQLAEYAFGLNPKAADADLLPVSIGGAVPGFSGDVSVRFRPKVARAHYVAVKVQYSTDGVAWVSVPPARVVANADASFTAAVPKTDAPAQLRLKVVTIPPSGSAARTATFVVLE